MTLLELFWTFFKIGAFNFGGGYAMLPIVSQQVLNKGWMNSSDIVDFIAISESSPGPLAINMATYVGTSVGGLPGAVCATFGVVLPSFIIILIVAKIFDKFRKSKWTKNAMKGIKPCAIGLIAAALLSLGTSVFFENGSVIEAINSIGFYVSAVIFAFMSVLSIKKVNPILIITVCAALGIILGYSGII